jgi:hypothetical protein
VPPPGNCPNCGTPITGEYCASCGQRTTDVRMSVRRILMDVLEDQFSLNSGLIRTLRALFFRPGLLTTEYFALRIARYVPPFRLYLIASLLLFVFLSFLTGGDRLHIEQNVSTARDSLAAAVSREADAVARESGADSVPRDSIPRSLRFGVWRNTDVRGVRVGVTGDSIGNWADSVNVNTGIGPLDRAAKARLQELGRLPPAEAFRRLFRAFVEATPKIMFLVLPIYALILKLLYILRKRLYVEHFIFALHVHAFLFLLFFVMLLLRSVPYAPVLLWLWTPFYLLFAMKRVYGQGWFMTTAKWMVLGFAYIILLSFGLAAALIGAVITA